MGACPRARNATERASQSDSCAVVKCGRVAHRIGGTSLAAYRAPDPSGYRNSSTINPLRRSARPPGDCVLSNRNTSSPVALRFQNARLVSDVKNSETLSRFGCRRTIFESIVDPHRPVPTMKTGSFIRCPTFRSGALGLREGVHNRSLPQLRAFKEAVRDSPAQSSCNSRNSMSATLLQSTALTFSVDALAF